MSILRCLANTCYIFTATLTRGTIKWDGKWISFLDNMLQCMLFPNAVYRNKFIPQNVDYFYINPKDHMKKIVNGGTRLPLLIQKYHFVKL